VNKVWTPNNKKRRVIKRPWTLKMDSLIKNIQYNKQSLSDFNFFFQQNSNKCRWTNKYSCMLDFWEKIVRSFKLKKLERILQCYETISTMSLEVHRDVDSTNISIKTCSKITRLKYVQILTYSIFFSISLLLLITETTQSVKIYLKGPTYTETLLHNQENTTFPVITVCPLDNGYKDDILKVRFCITKCFRLILYLN
jgi:hypothetical protein